MCSANQLLEIPSDFHKLLPSGKVCFLEQGNGSRMTSKSVDIPINTKTSAVPQQAQLSDRIYYQISHDLMTDYYYRSNHPPQFFPSLPIEVWEDFKEITDAANEEGFPPPDASVINNARRLAKQLFDLYATSFEVSPTPDTEVAIHIRNGRGQSVLILCEPDGGALCLVNVESGHRRAKYSTTSKLPDGFIREALAELHL